MTPSPKKYGCSTPTAPPNGRTPIPFPPQDRTTLSPQEKTQIEAPEGGFVPIVLTINEVYEVVDFEGQSTRTFHDGSDL